ncbi:predicted protein [Botrytis cinerea T4]|uniref:Uncharacterized protein n=1 Tax=Botryotinia fuckeliana (strain T4) TaxID=999810 RepID=G2YTN6_BOTF4|nr:predicted protein [Botrytis cinerea T4]
MPRDNALWLAEQTRDCNGAINCPDGQHQDIIGNGEPSARDISTVIALTR